MHELRPAPSPLLKASAFVARWTLALLLFAWLLVGAGWGLLHLAIVPRIGEFRPQLEATASRVLGITVRIEAISAYSTGLIPAFELTNISLLDAQGREALRLPRVLVSLSPKSVLALKFDQLYVDSPTLNIRRAADGRIFVAGFDAGSGSANNDVLDRLFSQPELAIRHGAVVWTDEQRGLPALALRDVDVVMRNAARRHDFRFDATPPAEWGDRFGLVARFEQPFLSMRNGRWQAWSGQVFANFDRVDISQLKRYAALGVDLREGRGALRSWVEVRRGEVAAATVDVALAGVVVGLDPALQPMALANLSGRLAGSYSPKAWTFSTQHLAFDTADGLRWPGGNLALSQTAADASRPVHGELQADRLDLAALSQIATRLPLAPTLHALLAQHAPGGLVDSLKATWEGTADALSKYEVKGKVRQLRIQGYPAPVDAKQPAGHVAVGTPGLSGATLDFAMTEQAGKASLQIEDGSMEFPGVFEEPRVPMRHFSGDVSWQMDNGKLRVDMPNARFGNADAEGEMRLHWQTSDPVKSRSGARFPGVLDLQGSLSRADGTRVFRYLPLVLHQRVRDYVRDAVQAGASPDVKFKVKGDLHDMPFADPKLGEFQISAAIRNGVFNYVPRSLQTAAALPWPVLTQLSGDLVFDRNSMRINGARGLVGTQAVQLTRGDATIADLVHTPVVVVNAEARGALTEMLSAVSASPLAAMTGNALAGTSATGNAELKLKLSVPMDKPAAATVQGSVALAGNDVLLAADTPRLGRVRGVVNFSESGFGVNGLQARVLGGDMRVDGGTPPLAPGSASASAASAATSTAAAAAAARVFPNVSFRAQGTITAEGLRQARELGVAARLGQYATGSAAYAATFGLRDGIPEFAISSNLAGMALNLPAPLVKTAESSMPLRLESALLREPAATAAGAAAARPRLQDQLVLDLGRVGSVTYVRDVSGAQPQVLRGAIAVGLAPNESAPLPPEGVMANVQVQALDLDAWSAVLAKLSAGGLPGLDPAAPDNSDAARAARSYVPTSVALRAAVLEAGGRKLHNLVAGGTRDGLTWRTNLHADELAGLVEYRQPVGAGAGRVYARLARLTLEQSSANDVETLLDDQPAAIPALDVVVEDLQLRGKKLGRLEIEAVNRFAGVREWRLNRFDVTTPEAVFKATGNWTALYAQSAAPAAGKPETRRTVMNFQLDILNAGELLGRFGMRDVVRRGKGSMEGQISWVGSPLSLDYPTLGGAFSVNVENGQFLKADPGLAKLLGVLSLQSLPRRLTLDFRDVFSEGFAFDFFRGDIKINQGIASANNLQMKGVNAAVLMDGQADLSRETQDLKVVVVPEINAGTASLIATAINPAIGLGSFLAQLFLRRPLMELATQEFHVDGSWLDPRITRVARRAPSP